MACVSIVIPVYNKAAFLPECLDSVLGQSIGDLEVVCVDDASTDGSADVLADYARRDRRIRLVHGSENRGPGPSRNIGIAVASAPYVQFTDADDLLPTHALEALHARALADDVPVVRGTIEGFSCNGVEHQEILSAVADRTAFAPFDEPQLWIPWWHPSFLISRRLLIDGRIGYPRLRAGEDPVFLTSVLKHAPRMSTIPDVTYRYRVAAMEAKERATFGSLVDYVQHARIVRQMLASHRAECWTEGYGPLVSRDIETLIERYPLDDRERERLRADAVGLSEPSNASAPRILFAYRLCGLGGVETTVLNKAKALRRLGATVEVLFMDFWGEGGRHFVERDGVHVLPQREAQLGLLKRGWDTVVVIDTPELVDLVVASGIDCVLLFETHASYRPILPYYYSRVSDAAVHAVIAPSEFNKRLLVDAGYPADRVRIIPNALDPDEFNGHTAPPAACLASLPDDRPVVLSIGRVEPQKDTLAFVRAASALLAAGHRMHFAIVGDAVDTQDYAARVHAAVPEQYGGSFTFISQVRHDSMPHLYLQAARSGGCLVITSKNESQPMTMLEAMACGCPVVAPELGGIGELVLDGETGVLYPGGAGDDVVAAIEHLVMSPALRQRIVRQARDHLAVGHSPAASAELYMSVTSSKKTARRAVDAGGALAESERASLALPMNGPVPPMPAERGLGALFSRPAPLLGASAVEAYVDIVPGVQVGFEPTGAARLSIEPRTDYSHSPCQCRYTVTVQFSGASNWFTLELLLQWEEVRAVERFQIGLYVRASRQAAGQAVLRMPRSGGGALDLRLSDFVLMPDERSCHCLGEVAIPDIQLADTQRRPRLIFFFDPSSDLSLKFDYLTAYFA